MGNVLICDGHNHCPFSPECQRFFSFYSLTRGCADALKKGSDYGYLKPDPLRKDRPLSSSHPNLSGVQSTRFHIEDEA
jgi:hypothetical protein